MNRLIQFKSSRWGAILLATVVAVVTCLAVANATQTITTPNAAFISYNLAGFGNSAAITPATNRSVLVMGSCTTGSASWVGQASLVHIPSFIIAWVGLDSNGGNTSGRSGIAGTHIVYLDFMHFVDIQTASADTIRVHNDSPATFAGNVTLIW